MSEPTSNKSHLSFLCCFLRDEFNLEEGVFCLLLVLGKKWEVVGWMTIAVCVFVGSSLELWRDNKVGESERKVGFL